MPHEAVFHGLSCLGVVVRKLHFVKEVVIDELLDSCFENAVALRPLLKEISNAHGRRFGGSSWPRWADHGLEHLVAVGIGELLELRGCDGIARRVRTMSVLLKSNWGCGVSSAGFIDGVCALVCWSQRWWQL